MKPLKILIVDDQPVNVKLLRAQLEAEGHAVLEATNGAEALAVLDRRPVDVIISDILMPVMDGYRLCYEVRRRERFRDLPFIVYTASYVSPSDEKLSLDLGADKYLRKPAPVSEILRVIAEALSEPRRKPTVFADTEDVLKEYNARLVDKLEQKNTDLTTAIDQLTLQTTALETAADAILITDAKGVILWTNPAFTTTTGYTAEEAIGKTPRILKSGKHDREFYRRFWETITSGQTWRGEFTNRRKDGTIRYDEHTITPVRDAEGSITHFVGVMHDITERKHAEEQLRESELRFRQIAETIRDVFFIQDPASTRMFYVSPAYEEIWGRTCESLYDQPGSWAEYIHPDDRAYAFEQFTAGMFTGFDYEFRIVRPDGDIRWIRVRGFPVRDGDGKPYRTAGVASDITEHKKAQDELRDSERRFREMLDNLELISVMLDLDARVTYCNDYFLRLTGWQREEVIGVNWFERFAPPKDADERRRTYEALLAEESAVRHHTNEIITRSGERRLVQWNNSLIYSPSGSVIGTASIAEDITDRTRMEQQLLRTQRLESLGTLAGGIAHDLNNLLLPILMGVTLLRRFDPNEQSMKAIENIERSVRRGRELVKQVLLFARGGDSTRQLVQLGDVVREVKSIADSTFPKDITFEILIDDDLRAAMGDPTQLVQVLLNLCVNARDAMPHGGQISISVTNADVSDHEAQLHGGLAGGPYVVMEVGDTGEGMSKQVIDRIFDPFFTTKDVGKGTGLGLSTVQGIVNSHGGFLSVSSLTGEGSTFTVSLPALPSSTETTTTSGKTGKSPQGHGELILVVDDDASVVSMTRQTLEVYGYEVLTAEDGAQAIGVFSRHHSDIALVLTDMSMPIIEGPALIAALNRISPKVRIIASTGNLSAAYITRITKTGVSHILTKPYTAGRLLRTIAEVLKKEEPS